METWLIPHFRLNNLRLFDGSGLQAVLHMNQLRYPQFRRRAGSKAYESCKRCENSFPPSCQRLIRDV